MNNNQEPEPDATHGGARQNSGRPKGSGTGRRIARFYITSEEETQIRAWIQTSRDAKGDK